MGNHEAAGGYPQNAGILVVLVATDYIVCKLIAFKLWWNSHNIANKNTLFSKAVKLESNQSYAEKFNEAFFFSGAGQPDDIWMRLLDLDASDLFSGDICIHCASEGYQT